MHIRTHARTQTHTYTFIHYLKQHFMKMVWTVCSAVYRVQTYITSYTHTHSQRTHLSIAHKCGVFSHQYVGSEKEDEGMTEAQEGPVQECPERQQRILADVPVGYKQF